MRRTLSLFIAGAMLASTMGFAPAQAASIQMPTSVTQGSGDIVQVRDRDHRRYRHYDRHNYRDHYRHRRDVYPFYFGFPFAFAPPYSYRDCYRAWNGRIYCRY